MRRAVERYLGQPEGSSSKPESVAAHRTLNLPLSRSGSRLSLHQEEHHQTQNFDVDSVIPIRKEYSGISTESMFSGRDPARHPISGYNSNTTAQSHLRKEEQKREIPIQHEQLVKEGREDKQMKSQWDTLYSPSDLNWKNSSVWNYSPGFGTPAPEYFRKDEALTKRSGTYPGDSNLQFESTFKKEICESITRY